MVTMFLSASSDYLVGPCYAGPKWGLFSCNMVLKCRRYMFVYESLTGNILKITPIRAGVEGASANLGRCNKDQQGMFLGTVVPKVQKQPPKIFCKKSCS